MKKIVRVLVTILFCVGLTVGSSVNSHSSMINIAYDFKVKMVRGDFLNGKVSVGDTVQTQGYYNTDAATLLYSNQDCGYYSFQAGQAGITYTVNGYTWTTTGALTVGIETASSQDYIGFLGYTAVQEQFPNGVNVITTQISGPGMISGVGNWMLFLPGFTTGQFSPPDLPTTLTMSQFDTTTPGLIQGALAGGPSSGPESSQFFFNFGNQGEWVPGSGVPLPGAILLLGAGLGRLALYRRREMNAEN